jgi:hypothetical protein
MMHGTSYWDYTESGQVLHEWLLVIPMHLELILIDKM